MGKLLDMILRGRREPYGGHVLLEEVAKGGMSRIYKARHLQTGELRAVKILTPESVELMQRFKRLFEAEEGAIALRLDHPNVVKTYSCGHEGKNEYYIAMEYVDGPNLEVLTALGDPRVVENRLNLLLQLGAGLRYIHQQGLIHRDFCPKNVLYSSDKVAKIIDFGLTIPAEMKHRAAMTRAGTPSYMAPEQVRSLPLDARVDIYAFGVSAFEILTGRRPFPVGVNRGRRMWEHLNVEPMPLRQVAPDMPEELEKVIKKCIEKDRDLRYKTMDLVMKDLRAVVNIALS